MRKLLAEEMAALAPALQRCAGAHALLLSATTDAPPDVPMLGHWTRLSLGDGRLDGDVRASAREPLPFVDEAFDLILLRHALERAPLPPALLQELVRSLAPGGVLVLTGVHPLSGWIPWWHWRTRGRPLRLHTPWRLGSWLRRAELQVEQVRRVGRAWPSASAGRPGGGSFLGGGYLLLARKRRAMVLPVRLRPQAVAARANAGLVSRVRHPLAA